MMSTSHPRVSIIIPTYNRKAKVQAAIASIYNQTVKGCEVIIVDDASTDGTAEWITQHYPDIHLITLTQNRGAAGARNVGIQAAQGEFVAFLDSDDQWLPNYLERHLQALHDHPTASFSACDCFSIQDDGTKTVFKSKPWPVYSSPLHHMLMSPLILTMSLVVARRSALVQAGPLNESLKICHDRELYLRLLHYGDFIHIPYPLANRIQGSDSLTKNIDLYAREVLMLLDIFFADPRSAEYQTLRSEAKSRWALNIARTLSELKMKKLLWLKMMLKAFYFSPGLVFRAFKRRFPKAGF